MLTRFGVGRSGVSGTAGRKRPNFGSIYISGVVAHWNLNETSGVRRDSVSAFNASVVGTSLTAPVGKIGNGVSITANTTYLNVPDNTAFNPGLNSFSISLWVKRVSGSATVLTKDSTYRISYNSSGFLQIYAQSGSTFVIWDGVASLQLSTTNWYHLAFVVNRTTGLATVYLNGVASGGTKSLASLGVVTSINPLRFGRDASGEVQIDEITYFNRAITAAEVAAIYNGGAGVAYSYRPYLTPSVASVQISPSGSILNISLLADSRATSLTATDSENVSGFSLTVNGSPATLGRVRINGTSSMSAVLNEPVPQGADVLLSYDATGAIVDSIGSNFAAFSNRPVTNNTAYGTTSSKGIGVMSTRSFARTSKIGSDTGKEAIVSFRHEVPYGLSAGWTLPFLGFSDGTAATIQIDHCIVTIEEPGQPAARRRITFGGVNGATVAQNVVVESDADTPPVMPGAVIRVSMLYRTVGGGSLPYCNWGYTTATQDGCLVGDTGTLTEAQMWADSTNRTAAPPTPVHAGLNSLIRAYQPVGIIGRPHPSYSGTEVVLGFIGDSINIAQNDYGAYTAGDPNPTRGWNGRFCQDDVPYVIFGQSGSNAGGFTSAYNNGNASAIFAYLFGDNDSSRKVTHMVDEYGINTIRNQRTDGQDAAAVWALRQQCAAIAAAVGIKYAHTTLTPMTSTWLQGNTANGDAAAQFAHFVSERAAFNTKVRTDSGTISGCIGYIDWQDAVESDYATNGNTWVAASNNDGIHPGSVGHQAMSAKMALAPFTANPRPLP